MPGKRGRKAGHEAIGFFPRDKSEEFVSGESELRGAVGNAETGGTGREVIGSRWEMGGLKGKSEGDWGKWWGTVALGGTGRELGGQWGSLGETKGHWEHRGAP